MKYIITITLILLLITGCTKSTVKTDNSNKKTAKIIEEYPNFQCEEEKYAYAKKYYSENKAEKCVAAYKLLLKEYPATKHADEAYFMMGYLYNSQLSDTVKAKKNYNYLLKNYPNSDFSSSAKFELQHLGKPDFIPVFEVKEEKKQDNINQ